MKNFDLRGQFYERLCILCERHKGSMTSGFRTEKRNKAAGGSEWSQHTYGLAIDVVLDDMGAPSVQRFIEDCWRFGLIPVDEQGHIHVQCLPKFNANA